MSKLWFWNHQTIGRAGRRIPHQHSAAQARQGSTLFFLFAEVKILMYEMLGSGRKSRDRERAWAGARIYLQQTSEASCWHAQREARYGTPTRRGEGQGSCLRFISFEAHYCLCNVGPIYGRRKEEVSSTVTILAVRNLPKDQVLVADQCWWQAQYWGGRRENFKHVGQDRGPN